MRYCLRQSLRWTLHCSSITAGVSSNTNLRRLFQQSVIYGFTTITTDSIGLIFFIKSQVGDPPENLLWASIYKPLPHISNAAYFLLPSPSYPALRHIYFCYAAATCYTRYISRVTKFCFFTFRKRHQLKASSCSDMYNRSEKACDSKM
jgi:hypothetical protein